MLIGSFSAHREYPPAKALSFAAEGLNLRPLVPPIIATPRKP
jgi:hypothetical protein